MGVADELKKQIGERIKNKRLERGYTRETLSEKISVSTQFLTEIEFGRRGMSIQTLSKICHALNTPADYILNGKYVDEKQEILHTIQKLDDDICTARAAIEALTDKLEK